VNVPAPDPIAPLLALRRCVIWNTLRTVAEHSRLKIALIGVLGGAIWLGLFAFPLYGFNWIVRILHEGSISDALISLFFFVLTVMLVFSNAVIAYTALFRSEEASFLRACPFSPGTVFLYKLAESLAFSSWAFVLLGVPIMLAYGVHKGAPWYYYLAILFVFAAFVLIPAALGALIALVLSAVLRPWSRKILIWAGVVVVVMGLTFGPARLRNGSDERSSIFASMRLFRRMSFTHSVWLPSAWVSRTLTICARSPGSGRLEDALYYAGLLASHSLFLCLLGCVLANRAYDGAWNATHSNSRRARSRWLALRLARCATGSPTFHLVLKDLKTFVRDPVQWTQCLVLFGLLGFYILNLRNLPYPSDQPFWRTLTTYLNLGSICLVLATLTTRFVFPMFSLEGRRFWMLGLAPMKRTQVLWSKLAFSFAVSFAVTETLMIASDLMLHEPLKMMLFHAFAVAMISAGLSGLAVGLSALYPNLRETSPAKIVSGFGGTLNLILSLLFVAVVVSIEALPVLLWIRGGITRTQFGLILVASGVVIFALAAATFAVPMCLGSRALARMEF